MVPENEKQHGDLKNSLPKRKEVAPALLRALDETMGLAEAAERGGADRPAIEARVRAAVTAEGRIRWASVAGGAAAETSKLSLWRFFGVLTKSLRSSPDFLRTLGNHVSGPFEITMRKSRTFEN